MKKAALFLLFIGVFFICSGLVINYQIQVQIQFNIAKKKSPIIKQNDYYRDYDFNYVKRVTNAYPKNYQDLLNIIYSTLNNGYDSISFYCSDEYVDCLKDIEELGGNQEKLSTINNYVHPYNSFENAKILYNENGNIKIDFKKYYNAEDITLLNSKVDSIYTTLYIPTDSDIKNIKRFHDYIINSTRYDSDRVNKNLLNYRSNIAYGSLIEGYAVCGGYSDAMQLFLDKMNLKNFKVATNEHVWNAVLLDGRWYNLDLTWDDPVVSDGLDYLDDTYFLIKTEKMLKYDTTQHTFNIDNYSELKNS